MADISQQGRPLQLTSPFDDKMLPTALKATETISELFRIQVEAIVPTGMDIAFDKLLGKPCTAILFKPVSNEKRHFHGLVRTVHQGESDLDFTAYQLDLVPAVWALTKIQRNRIFQQITVPDILKKVFAGFDVDFKAIQGTFEPRDYVVQYRESDFSFASRLMEDEGIFYYFKHTADGHKMVLSNVPDGYADSPFDPKIVYRHDNQSSAMNEDNIYHWGKEQSVTSGKVALWDHNFELPGKNLEATADITATLKVGGVSHNLKAADNGKLEIYDFPGSYAGRFDGVSPGGGNRGDVQKIFKDNIRTVKIRMEEEAARAVGCVGASTCRQLGAGHKFTVETVTGEVKIVAVMKPEGEYVIQSVTHVARMEGQYRAGGSSNFTYSNSFNAIPSAAAFRPERTTYKPTVYGCQTATVVGPPGEEIFTDKYSRIKVQFHWDREGTNTESSSCWIRVGTPWAGRGWGMLHIPRVGQEVIVDFLEGDPDQPIVIGSVYNADQMPAYQLPGERTKSYLKSNTSPGGVGHNEFRLEDKKGSEQIFIHGERNEDIRIKNDCMENIMHDRHLTVGVEKDGKKSGSQTEEVKVDKALTINRDHSEHIGRTMNLHIGGIDGGKGDQNIIIDNDKHEIIKNNFDLTIVKNLLVKIGGTIGLLFKSNVDSKIEGVQTAEVVKNQITKIGGARSLSVGGSDLIKIGGDENLEVVGASKTKVGGDVSLKVAGKTQIKTGSAYGHEAGQEIHLKAGMKVIIEAGVQISLKGPGGFIDIGPAGVTIQGTMVLINSGGAAGSGSGAAPEDPKAPADVKPPGEAAEPAEFTPKKPVQADNSDTGKKSN